MQISKIIDRLYQDRQSALKEKKRLRSKLDTAKRHVTTCVTVQGIIQSVSLSVQKDMHEKIANVVTRCLQTVFPDPYEFQIIFDKKRGKTEARLVFVRNGEEYDPLDESGGGCIDVATLGLSIATLLLADPKPEPILFLDEPFKYLDKDSPEKVVMLLEQLSREFKIQIVQSTHNPALVCGKEIRL